MRLNTKESEVFARRVYAELKLKIRTAEQYRRQQLFASVKDKWEELQDKVVSIDGRQFVLPPVKPCDIFMTGEELEAVTELFARIKDCDVNDRAELDSIMNKLRSEETGKWLILIWEYTKNYIFRFSSMNGTRGDVIEHLQHIVDKELQEDQNVRRWNTSISRNGDSRRDSAVMISRGDNKYIAVPIMTGSEWVFVTQRDDGKNRLNFEFSFRKQMPVELSDDEAKKILKRMWKIMCKGKLEDPPEARVMKNDSGCLYANEYLPDVGSVSIIGLPLALLSDTNEIALDMADLMMSTVDRIDDAMNGIEETFAAALRGEDKSLRFQDCMKTMRELVETFLIPEVLEH